MAMLDASTLFRRQGPRDEPVADCSLVAALLDDFGHPAHGPTQWKTQMSYLCGHGTRYGEYDRYYH